MFAQLDHPIERVRSLINDCNRKQRWGVKEAVYLAALRDIPFSGVPIVVYFSEIKHVVDGMDKSLCESMKMLNHALMKEMEPYIKEIDAFRREESNARLAKIATVLSPTSTAASIVPALPSHPEKHFLKAVMEENLPKIDELVRAGFPIDSVITDKNSRALHIACEEKKLKSVQRLIALGADVNAEAIMGFKPLHIAAQQGDNRVTIALLKAGASLEARTEDGKGSTALHEAVWHGMLNSVKCLIAAGANSSAPRMTATGKSVSPIMLAKNSALTGLAMPLEAIIYALEGPERTFIRRTQELIQHSETKYEAKNEREKNYIERLKAIPYLVGKTEEYALFLETTINEGFEAVKEKMAPLRLAIMNYIAEYKEEIAFTREIQSQLSTSEARKSAVAVSAGAEGSLRM